VDGSRVAHWVSTGQSPSSVHDSFESTEHNGTKYKSSKQTFFLETLNTMEPNISH
jgi:hypothetical protein